MTKKVLKNENRSTDQLATVSSRQYFFLSLRHSWINILPHFCISFHVSLVQYEYGRGLWFNCKVSTDSADLSSFHKHWHYSSDRNTQKVVCRVQPLFRNALVIFRKLAHEIANLKNSVRKFWMKIENGWEKLKTPTAFSVELRTTDAYTKTPSLLHTSYPRCFGAGTKTNNIKM